MPNPILRWNHIYGKYAGWCSGQNALQSKTNTAIINCFTSTFVRTIIFQKESYNLIPQPFFLSKTCCFPYCAKSWCPFRTVQCLYVLWQVPWAILYHEKWLLTNDNYCKLLGAIWLGGWWSHLPNSLWMCFISSCLSNLAWSYTESWKKLWKVMMKVNDE